MGVSGTGGPTAPARPAGVMPMRTARAGPCGTPAAPVSPRHGAVALATARFPCSADNPTANAASAMSAQIECVPFMAGVLTGWRVFATTGLVSTYTVENPPLAGTSASPALVDRALGAGHLTPACLRVPCDEHRALELGDEGPILVVGAGMNLP